MLTRVYKTPLTKENNILYIFRRVDYTSFKDIFTTLGFVRVFVNIFHNF